jgi:hypothetical protein
MCRIFSTIPFNPELLTLCGADFIILLHHLVTLKEIKVAKIHLQIGRET